MSEAPFTLSSPNAPVAEELTPIADLSVNASAAGVEDGMWVPVDLPSMGHAGYPAQLLIRKFSMPDFVRVGVARKNSNFGSLVAAIGATIKDFDVRLLTNGDFDFLMYWHASNSLTTSKTTVTWTSRYGYENKTVVDKSLRKVISIENGDAVTKMRAKGYDFSRIGDELFRLHHEDAGTLTDALEFELQLATFVAVADPSDVPAKITKLRTMQDLSFYEGLDEWRTIAYHGVRDSAMLTCKHFTPEAAEARITLALQGIQFSGEALDPRSMELMRSLLEELAEITKLTQENRLSEARPKEEEIILPLDANNFFPVVL